MCRILIFHGRQPITMADLITKPTHSIIRQSYAAQERIDNSPLNGDGFGIGWYTKGDTMDFSSSKDKEDIQTPCVFLSVTPAWNNLNLIRLAEKIKSPLFFGHVRAASPGILTSETNCHPFLFGQFIWMHNGVIAEFPKIKRSLMGLLDDELYLHIQGTTDSEAIFMLYLNILKKHIPGKNLKQEKVEPCLLKQVMEETIQQLLQWNNQFNITTTSHMNFAISDGKTVIVTRYTYPSTALPVSLYFASGSQFTIGKDNDYEMHQTDRRQTCHIIASEPLSKNVKDWIPVPRDHLLMITSDSTLLIFPVSKQPTQIPEQRNH
uniref:Glutamine amidotransferase type-2 domain-containing protein n=1 Tax=Arcella intermedia TaxID=1963864 RepID=A0A6B2LAB9_9EUKA|eukprot:TRINITY_DN4382_c0_g1_i1.p1 TRINITY_DN4382_c0_g1~~TRINITY_DN4382_c0_g1_i1.p1  ORF type:complete len:330 (+),score=67.97 TRINITY_DN4382_c0_g1_i1:30-992(+)